MLKNLFHSRKNDNFYFKNEGKIKYLGFMIHVIGF